jgi:predicted DNA-binding transcriptional regulator AlpA
MKFVEYKWRAVNGSSIYLRKASKPFPAHIRLGPMQVRSSPSSCSCFMTHAKGAQSEGYQGSSSTSSMTMAARTYAKE